jgi:PAS domain S-box-containing protein
MQERMKNVAATPLPRKQSGAVDPGQEQFRLFFEANPAPLWVHEEQTMVFLAVNHAAVRLYGYSQAEFLTMTAGDLWSAEDAPAFLQMLERHRGQIAAPGGIWRHRKKDRAVIEVEVAMSAVTYLGRPAWLVLAHDLTERQVAQESLRLAQELLELRGRARTADLEAAIEALVETQERFRQMAENIREVFWLSNPSRTSIIYVSPGYQEIWGRTCESLYQKPSSWFEAIHPEDRPRAHQLFKEPIPRDGCACEYRLRRPDGSVRWVLERGFPVRDNYGRIHRLVGIARDITDRKELEREILAISEREQRRIGQDLHDDLCQQLAGIEFLSKALQQQLSAQPQADQAGEIATLLRAANDHTRVLARGLAPVELEAGGLMQGLEALAQRTSALFRVQCTFECPAPVWLEDLSVSTHLYRIAQEAVTNGIKHGKSRKIEIQLTVAADRAVLEICDNGAGLTDNPAKPRGMGLRIMQYRADLIGATFAMQAGVQGGTRVLCSVPLTAAPQPQR